MKNTIISSLKKFIVFMGLTTQGSFHDYALFKEEFPPDLDWFELIKVFVDLGYLGIEKDYPKAQVFIPEKKSKKTDKTSNSKLNDDQKNRNKAKSKIRIYVENAIAGIKRYNILAQKYRNKRKNFEDDVIAIAAGLWNLEIKPITN